MKAATRSFEKIAFVAADHAEAVEARAALVKAYGSVPEDSAEAIVALGGDGLMLQTLHRFMNTDMPIYGMNCGSVGFMMNDYSEEDLPRRLADAKRNIIRPLRMKVLDQDNVAFEALAINESSPTALFIKGQVLWCSATDLDQAEELFAEVLENPDLEQVTRDVVETDLQALQAGAACT